jgi:hypothetical protein
MIFTLIIVPLAVNPSDQLTATGTTICGDHPAGREATPQATAGREATLKPRPAAKPRPIHGRPHSITDITATTRRRARPWDHDQPDK